MFQIKISGKNGAGKRESRYYRQKMGREERQREWEIEKEIWWRRVKISDMDSDLVTVVTSGPPQHKYHQSIGKSKSTVRTN